MRKVKDLKVNVAFYARLDGGQLVENMGVICENRRIFQLQVE